MGKRMTAEEVANLRKNISRHDALPTTDVLVRLCDSHEVYRGFAQRFIDIYSGVAAQKIERSGATIDRKPYGAQDAQQVLFFQLFLEIVGPIAPKV